MIRIKTLDSILYKMEMGVGEREQDSRERERVRQHVVEKER
jgi:hypothetical protein